MQGLLYEHIAGHFSFPRCAYTHSSGWMGPSGPMLMRAVVVQVRTNRSELGDFPGTITSSRQRVPLEIP